MDRKLLRRVVFFVVITVVVFTILQFVVTPLSRTTWDDTATWGFFEKNPEFSNFETIERIRLRKTGQ